VREAGGVRRSRGECSQKPRGRQGHRMRACLSARAPLRISVRPHAHRVVPRRAGQGADAARGLVPPRRQHVGAGDDGPEDGCRRHQCKKRIRHSRRCLPAWLALRVRAAEQVSRTCPAFSRLLCSWALGRRRVLRSRAGGSGPGYTDDSDEHGQAARPRDDVDARHRNGANALHVPVLPAPGCDTK
jgi:hypothetical protein